MKLIISIVIVTICLFPAIESGAEYNVEPYYQRAVTIPALEGKYWKLCTSQYPCQYSYCYTDQEVGDWLVENPYGWAILDDERGSCKKCSSYLYELWPYNGEDVCIFYMPCYPDWYEFMNYKGRDDCFICPNSYPGTYEFNDDNLCQWAGPGPQPSSPPPTQPTGLEASDGTSFKNVIISWYASNWVTDYYAIERSDVLDPATGRSFFLPLEEVRSVSGPGTEIKYYDKTAERNGRVYYYRVLACNERTGQCSGPSLSDSGYIAWSSSIPSVNNLLLGK